MRQLIVLLACASCARLPHVPAQPRSAGFELLAAAQVDVQCEESADLGEFTWEPPKYGTAVIISERHVLTSAHVVQCPVIPSIRLTLTNGRPLPMVVDKDDAMFGDGTDVARLEILSAERFELGIAPPQIASGSAEDYAHWGTWCAATTRQMDCGDVRSFDAGEAVFGAKTQDGDSGAGVYDERGQLVGLVSAGSRSATKVTLLTPKWLEGL